jgi:hypothetical protein
MPGDPDNPAESQPSPGQSVSLGLDALLKRYGGSEERWKNVLDRINPVADAHPGSATAESERPGPVEADAAARSTEVAATTAEAPVVEEAKPDSRQLEGSHRRFGTKGRTKQKGSDWAAEAEKAVSRAFSSNSPDAWRRAAQVAAAVAEMAQVMHMAADAKETADHKAQIAAVAAEAESVAERAAADADADAQKKAKIADETAKAAEAASREATEARMRCEKAAQRVPDARKAAQAATRDAANAAYIAKHLEEIVAEARSSDARDAWSEALRVATSGPIAETGPGVGASANSRVSAPPGVAGAVQTHV